MGKTSMGSAPDPAATFDTFVMESRSRLLGQAHAFCGDMTTAHDLLQEAYLKAWQHWETISAYDDPGAWTRRVLYNAAVSSWRSTRRRRQSEWQRAADDRGRRAAAAPDLEHLDLVKALQTLPEPQRMALVLYHLAGLRVHEIAADMGIPQGTVKSHLSRGRTSLAGILGLQSDHTTGS